MISIEKNKTPASRPHRDGSPCDKLEGLAAARGSGIPAAGHEGGEAVGAGPRAARPDAVWNAYGKRMESGHTI